jgi:uncharacterized protein (TIGR03084 family)
MVAAEVEDLRAEGAELYALLEMLSEEDWRRVTQFKGWSIEDVVLHLYASDVQAAASARSPEAYRALRSDIVARRGEGLTIIEEARVRYAELRGSRLLARWRDQLAELCDLLAAKEPQARLLWGGPDMSVRMFTTARQMEIWAHGQAIYDLLGHERTLHARIRNVAVIGVKTFGWTFSNRKLPVPAPAPYVRLTAPSGETWEWNAPQADNSVQGDAGEFCQVVAQTRNVADTQLAVTGETARAWMSIAQCFAGAPHDPPPKGTRYKSGASAGESS